MYKKYFKFSICFLLILTLLCGLCGCNSKNNPIKINYLAETPEIEKYEDKWVTFIGFMTTTSTSDGKTAYITYKPAQETPSINEDFFIMDAIVIETNKRLTYTTAPVKVTGRLTFNSFENSNGFKFYRKIENATVEVVNKDDIPENIKNYADLLYSDYMYSITLLLNSINYFSNYESLGVDIKDVENNGIDFYDYQKIRDSIQSNKYNDKFIEILDETNELCNKINEKIKEKKYTELKDLSTEYTELQTKYNNFCNKIQISPNK